MTADSTKMREVAEDVASQRTKYNQVVSDLQNLITNLGNYWESVTYDQFKQLFDGKKPSLDEGSQIIQEFINGLTKAADEFDETQKKILNNLN